MAGEVEIGHFHEDNIKVDLVEIGCDDSTWLELSRNCVLGGINPSVSLTRELIVY